MRSARGGRDAAGQQNQQIVPRAGGAATLPLLPLFDAVLLPGGVARVTIPAGWHKSGSLVELLLQQEKGEAPVVAAVPYLTGKGGGAAAAPASSGGGGGEEEGAGEEQLDLDRLHHTGTAARVLQLVRRTQVRHVGWRAAGPDLPCGGSRAAWAARLPCRCTPAAALHPCAPAGGRLDSGAGGAVPPARARRAPHLAPAAGAV